MIRKLYILLFLALVIGCSNNEESLETESIQNEDENEQENENDIYEIKQETNQENLNNEENMNEEVVEEFTEEVMMEASVEITDDKIVVNGQSNLLEGNTIDGQMYNNPFRIRAPMGVFDRENVNHDGSFLFEFNHPASDQGFYEIEITVSPTSQYGDLDEIYGESGENIRGPLTYKREEIRSDNILHRARLSKVFYFEDELTEFQITAPDREEVPEDYGETEVWIDVEVTNDHKYFYLEGKTNLLEGTVLDGMYYGGPDSHLPQLSIGGNFRTRVEPDGTFYLTTRYLDLKEEGYIKLSSWQSSLHTLSNNSELIYGEGFEKMTGEHVISDDGENKIEMILHPDVPGVTAPESAMVTAYGDETKVQVPDDVLFDYDESKLKEDAEEVLSEIIEILEELAEGTTVFINGHTDNEGDPDYNMGLSEERAESVKNYLEKNGDIGSLGIEKHGYGETQPVESNEDSKGRQKNRRVEIVINPND
ncbi:OmpA family protein [Salipaludibacillus sp. HK11]|uniref:OmpA family protein n=1 Tax=Salipaludibacillus sp. HK11 TaxID=3394320 RepID=UPI0039FBA300